MYSETYIATLPKVCISFMFKGLDIGPVLHNLEFPFGDQVSIRSMIEKAQTLPGLRRLLTDLRYYLGWLHEIQQHADIKTPYGKGKAKYSQLQKDIHIFGDMALNKLVQLLLELKAATANAPAPLIGHNVQRMIRQHLVVRA
ncbi:MAG: hypothetical protein DI585_05700 [Pseudomonas fluorescens]|nr:MAG: hypothetical protein DI585_05700 [Pseudomonas fluorescens]